jgi:thiol-disulfide isomerase/thioredoxin
MFRGMKRAAWLTGLLTAALLRAADPAPDPLEQQVAGIIAGPQVTVVHFWAPWCANCRAEMDPAAGWAKFVTANPDVRVVFLNIWHKGQDPAPRLAESGLGAQPNLLLLHHPNRSRLEETRLNSFLGLPLTWVPTTWLYREGKLRAAFNYGEIRFGILQQLVDDARNEWQH